jgi:coenzyme PQQ precursor peptide PqqA
MIIAPFPAGGPTEVTQSHDLKAHESVALRPSSLRCAGAPGRPAGGSKLSLPFRVGVLQIGRNVLIWHFVELLPAMGVIGGNTMAWTTPTLIEICIGLEINGYLPAEF